jgi:hypothetical protein
MSKFISSSFFSPSRTSVNMSDNNLTFGNLSKNVESSQNNEIFVDNVTRTNSVKSQHLENNTDNIIVNNDKKTTSSYPHTKMKKKKDNNKKEESKKKL